MHELILGDRELISPKQIAFFNARARHVGFGGARGGGKSWAVRAKAKLLALRYPGIRILIVRRTYPELVNNHVTQLRSDLLGVAQYNDRDKVLRFEACSPTGDTSSVGADGAATFPSRGRQSSIQFMYCAKDADLDHLQGVEYDVIFLDEATQLSEFQMKSITACVRGANTFPKRVYYTMNPGGQGHSYLKRIFIDRRFEAGEDPRDYVFIPSLVTDNLALMKLQPDYVKQLEALPPRLRDAWRYGRWDVYEGQFFEELRLTPDPALCEQAGIAPARAAREGRFTHVIPGFCPPRSWRIYRSFDWGYAKPFSCAWWAVDQDGRIYRILELYGCTRTPNEGVKWTPQRVFETIARTEREHPWLRGRSIQGVADPAIFDASTGQSVAEAAMEQGIFFSPGDHARIPGWMQCHYRLAFDGSGIPMMYVFEDCKAFLRTVPLMVYDPLHPEDLDTSLEDHVCDEWRYFCMSRPMKAVSQPEPRRIWNDPLGR